MNGHRGLLGSLFDLSFTSLVTTRIIRVAYGLLIAVVAVTFVVSVLIAFRIDMLFGVVTLLIIAPLYALLSLTVFRLVFEMLICFFRIQEHAAELVAIAGTMGAGGGAGTAAPGPNPIPAPSPTPVRPVLA